MLHWQEHLEHLENFSSNIFQKQQLERLQVLQLLNQEKQVEVMCISIHCFKNKNRNINKYIFEIH